MKTHYDLPGSPEWHARRGTCFNASDAPAMLGCSPHETRAQLLARMHSGIHKEFSSYAQERVIDPGHEYEAKARPVAEEIIGEDLAAVGGEHDFGLSRPLGASFDGITMLGDIVWEHKRMNADLRYDWDKGNGYHLPKHYQVQMEQQLMVSGAERALFMATAWHGGDCTEKKHCWYASDPALRAEILAGWKQFDADLAAYVPTERPVEKIVAEPVEALPAPVVQVSGQLALKDNFKVFEERLRHFLEHRLIRQPKTDEDFVNLDAQIKAMKQAREALKAAEAQMLAQVQPVDQAKKTKDMLDKLLQQNVSMAEGLLTAEKERRKGEIVAGGVGALKAHIEALNKRLGHPYMPIVPADFGGAVKGLKSLASMEDKVGTELARAKIAANKIADRIDANLKHLREHASEFKHLFPDTAAIVQKSPEDLAALVTARIAEHRAAEERRLAAERERIRREEQERADREAREKLQREEAAQRAQAPAPSPTPAPAPIAAPAPSTKPAAANSPNVVPLTRGRPSLRLGQINERIAPLKIDAAGLETLGFKAAGKEGAAVLFHEADFGAMVDSMVAHLRTAQHRIEEPEAA